MRRAWTAAEDATLVELYESDVSIGQIAAHLGRSYWSCAARIRRQGLERRRYYRAWTTREVDTLRRQSSQLTISELARLLRRSYKAVKQQLRNHKLRALKDRSPQYYALRLARLLRQRNQEGGLDVRALADQTGWSVRYTQRRLRHLQHLGYAQRDGRIYHLTPAGVAWVDSWLEGTR